MRKRCQYAEQTILNNLKKLVTEDRIDWDVACPGAAFFGPIYITDKIMVYRDHLWYDGHTLVSGYLKLIPLRKELKKSVDRQRKEQRQIAKLGILEDLMKLSGPD